jgi:ergothioneine biosynthesis protein EgtB
MTLQAVDNERQVLLSRFLEAREATDALFRMVSPAAMYDRPIPERHRIVFYVGHLEAFDWNLLGELANRTSAHPEFDRLFAFGIDPTHGDLPTDQPQDWPRLTIVNSYRDQVRQELDRAIETAAPQLINVAIEHRLMHAETLAYIFHQLPFEYKLRPAETPTAQRSSVAPGSVDIPAGNAELGLRRDSPVFGWDNEFDAHTVAVPGFTIDRYKVTNGQFLRFIEQGGYGDPSLWAPADWDWRIAQSISHPVFWTPRGERWGYRTMFEEIPLPPDWPVYCSYAEASAYARWAGKVLPTEPQWHRAAESPAPQGMIGTGWEWTSTEFAPFPGFQRFDCYPGYSEPFFDGRHYVLKGGSTRTAPCMLRRSFRNWFQPHYQYVYAGFRCVEADSK